MTRTDKLCNEYANSALYFACKLRDDLDFINAANARDHVVFYADSIIAARQAERHNALLYAYTPL